MFAKHLEIALRSGIEDNQTMHLRTTGWCNR
jgi:hypothetical protein